MPEQPQPDALMLLSSSCPHCSQVSDSLVDMLKQGELSSLKIVNLELQPELATQYDVRSVPWVKIGDVRFVGLKSRAELLNAARAYGTTDSMLIQLNELLTDGQLNKARELVFADARFLDAIMQVLENPESKINVRVGVGAILEEMSNTPELREYAEHLIKLTQHASATVRSDAAHYLSLTGSALAAPALRKLLNDENNDVREIAQDGLDELTDTT